MAERKGMKTKRKRRVITFFLIVLTVFPILTGFSFFKKTKVPVPNIRNNLYIYDTDYIIDENTEKTINQYLNLIEKETTAEVAVVTVPSLLGMEIEDYSIELANKMGIGKKESDNGVLLLISRRDKKVRIEVGRGLEGCLNDARCGRILDTYFVPYREEDRYSEASLQTIYAICAFIENEYGVQNTESAEIQRFVSQDIENERQKDQAIMYFIIIVLVAILLDVVFNHGRITLSILYALAESSSGSSSSSGGGYSGGGFGGGGFGGGGTSR